MLNDDVVQSLGLPGAAIVVAVVTTAPETCEALKSEVDEIICAITPEPFDAVEQARISKGFDIAAAWQELEELHASINKRVVKARSGD